MANFRLYPGLFVTVIEDLKTVPNSESLIVGEVLQVMYTKFHVAFIGKNGAYPISDLGKYVKPNYPKGGNNGN